MASPLCASDLLALIEKSELVSRAALDEYASKRHEAGDSPADAAGLAAAMVRDNLLTEFQARLLLQGKWKNFFLAGKYKVLEHLGTGGMGMVFLCEHRHMRRRVAVKALPPDPSDPEHARRFQREAQAVAMLDHPNIVRAFDVDREGNLHYLIMEYIDGASLQYLIDSRGPLEVDRAINYVAQAALGLQHAHDNGLVHRDVKPSNLMLDWAGTVKLLDLGLARFSRRQDNVTKTTEYKMVLGTADYLSPEQAESSAVDGRADVYALGGVAYFLLTGHPPFDGGNITQKLLRHQSEVPAWVSTIRPDVPTGVAQVIARMLEKDPAKRPRVLCVIAELKSWVEEVPPPTPEEMPPSRYAPHRDMDTNARHSTMSLLSKSSRALLLKTMIAAEPVS